MVSVQQARDIALFFLLSLLDQKQALAAAHKTIAQLKGMKAEHETHTHAQIARVLSKAFAAQRKMLSRNRPTELSEAVIQFPAGTDFATWQRFHRQSSDGEITAVVLTLLLGFSEKDAADGFSVSTGTMKYRVAKGMRQLGSVLAKVESRSQV